jgi:hypothetical protein
MMILLLPSAGEMSGSGTLLGMASTGSVAGRPARATFASVSVRVTTADNRG